MSRKALANLLQPFFTTKEAGKSCMHRRSCPLSELTPVRSFLALRFPFSRISAYTVAKITIRASEPEAAMDVISIVLMLFGILELSNVLVLYLAPGSRRGNSIGFFNAYEKSKQDPEVHALVSYLVNWVAGTKLIFIVLLIGILITGNPATKVFTAIALIFSIMTFFSRLYPSIKKMDEKGEITPHGYFRTLARMIGAFIAVFAGAVIVYFAGWPRP